MKAWAGTHRVMIELTPDEARALASQTEPLPYNTRPRLRYLADVADGLVVPRDAADAAEPWSNPEHTIGADLRSYGPSAFEGPPRSATLAEIIARDNSGQAVRHVLCVCDECEAADAAKYGRS